MIATLDEVRWFKKIITEEQSRCAAAGVPFDATMPVGGMIEVPSAVLMLEELCDELDFFSIGSNDLLQYVMATDRLNQRVAALYDPLQPAFLRLLHQIVEVLDARQKPHSLCGEMAAHRRYLPLLVGAGFKKISVASPAIAGLKADLAGLRQGDCRRLFALAHESDTASAVAAHLATFPVRQSAPLIRPELVADGVVAASKAEAIKQVVDLLNISGRAANPRAVEAAVWAREATYSTGFGHGCAIPHCQTDAVQVNSLAVLRLAQGVEWGSLDGQPVRLVILLVMRESDAGSAHMKVFARLARKLMHEPFRLWLATEKDPDVLCARLREALET